MTDCSQKINLDLLLEKHPCATKENLKILNAPSILCKTKLKLNESDVDQFKLLEKHFKYRRPFRQGKRRVFANKVDYKECIDIGLHEEELLTEGKIRKVESLESQDSLSAYQLTDKNLEGFYILPNFLSKKEQKLLVKHSLHNWCRKPAATNVRRLIELGHQDFVSTPDSETVLSEGGERVRWANLGYKYDWTHRKYFEQEPEISLPEILVNLSKKALKTANLTKYLENSYQPDSCLVNYYNVDTQFCGHIDDAELNAREFPIVSISIGLSAIFLHGKGENCQDRKIKPEAIVINSGDVIIMSDTSRLCLHGVPRICEDSLVEKDLEHLFDVDEDEDPEFTEVERDYIMKHRLNINVRMYKGNVKIESNVSHVTDAKVQKLDN